MFHIGPVKSLLGPQRRLPETINGLVLEPGSYATTLNCINVHVWSFMGPGLIFASVLVYSVL